jgi:branched-chain amino acid transport system substrate-binding protein
LRFNRLLTLGCVLAAAATGVAACGDDDDGGGGGGEAAGGGELHIYSSLPLEGAQREQNIALTNGIKLALEQAGNKAGDFTIKYTSLSDASAQAGNWTPELASANARRAAQDDKTAVYIGEFNSGASAVSIPILNEGGVPQISPSNTAVGLTSDDPGADKGEPDKYYPTGERTYLRIVPKDTIQGAAMATVMKSDGCTNVAIANDKEVYGGGLSRNIQSSAQSQGLKIAFNEGIDPKAANYRSLASRAKGEGVDCFAFSGTTPNNAAQIFKDFAAALPNAKLYGPDGVAEAAFFDPKEGGIPNNVGARTTLFVATLSPDEYPPEGQEFFKQYATKYGDKTPDPYAIYGYEVASLALDAIKRAGSSDKADILKALFATKDRKSVLGTYSIDENGDTSITDYGVYKIKDGELEFDKTVKAQT